jgi:hypothetical protein
MPRMEASDSGQVDPKLVPSPAVLVSIGQFPDWMKDSSGS